MGGKSRICGIRVRHRPGFFANFPIDEQRCRTWVQIVGKEDLVHIPFEKLHQVRFVCGDHFKAKDFNKKGNRLKKRAYPKLQLSAQPLSDHQLKDFLQHVASKVLAPAPMDDSTATPVIASSSKMQNMAATTQNIMTSAPIPMEEEVPTTPVLAACSTTPPAVVKASAPSHVEEVAPVLPSGSKTPLATSTKQNVIAPSPTPIKKNQAYVPVLDSASTTTQTIMDWDKSKDKLIRQLQNVKSTVRSLKRNANLIDRLESPMVKEIVESRNEEIQDSVFIDIEEITQGLRLFAAHGAATEC